MDILKYIGAGLLIFSVSYFAYTLISIANDAMKLKEQKWELNTEL